MRGRMLLCLVAALLLVLGPPMLFGQSAESSMMPKELCEQIVTELSASYEAKLTALEETSTTLLTGFELKAEAKLSELSSASEATIQTAVNEAVAVAVEPISAEVATLKRQTTWLKVLAGVLAAVAAALGGGWAGTAIAAANG